MRVIFARHAVPHLLCAAALAGTLAAHTAWALLRPEAIDPTTANLPVRSMHRMTVSDGWVLAGDRILWTNTAGQSWVDISPPLEAGQAIDTVYFLDSGHGWAILHATGSDGLPTVLVAATSNGGGSWSTRPVPLTEFLRSLYSASSRFSFVDAGHGWLILRRMSGSAFSKADLFATSDGGKTWSALPAPPIAGSIRFTSASTGWLVGGVHGNELYRTQDGGQSWAEKVMPAPSQVQPYAVPQERGSYVVPPVYGEPFFETFQKGLLGALFTTGRGRWALAVYSTADGGNTWEVERVDSDLPSAGTLATFDSTVLAAFKTAGSVDFRRGSAHATAPLPVGLSNRLSVHAVEFQDVSRGWVLMSSGPCGTVGCVPETALLSTEDGGSTLTLLLRSVQTGPERLPAGVKQEGRGLQPDIGGATGVSGMGVDSCSYLEPDFLNSIYGTYWSADYTVLGFYLGGELAVHTPSPNCYIETSEDISQTAP